MAKDSKMYYLEEDIQKIQVKTNMYINEYGEAGAFHLSRELIQNNFDECLDDDSPGNQIEIEYDMETDILRSSDNGRGFNESEFPMSIFCTTLQSGSKFFRSSGAESAGEFGVGMTVVNALSDSFKLKSYREKEGTVHTLEYHEGVLQSDTTKSNKNGRHGTTVEFRVSKKYMGAEAKLPIDDVVAWIDSLFYLNSRKLEQKGITCKLTVFNGMKIEKVYKFKPKHFSELLTKMIPANIKKKQMTDPCFFDGATSFVENSKILVENEDGTTSVEMVDVEKVIHIDTAFQYCTSPDMNDVATYDTYCNYTNTTENGVHLDAFDEAFCRFMQNKINVSMSDAQKSKLKITWDDIRTNLFCVLNLSTNAYVGFVGNAKEKIGNKELIPYIKEVVTTGLENFFDSNKGLLDEYIRLIKLNAKARQEAAKAKVATSTERLNSFKELAMSNYIPCNNKGKQWKEIFLVEGNSAAGSVRNGSNPDTQAAFLFRGVTANAMKCSLSEIMQNREWRDLVTVLRCGIGPKFDPDKLYFDRINILTDADIDGYYINSGMLAFFYKYMRPLIERGKIYKVYTPLYRVNDKNQPYIGNKAQMVDVFFKNIMKKYKIKLADDESYLDKDDLYDFLSDTYDYRDNLILAAENSGRINKFFIEMISAYLTMYGVDEFNYEDKFKDQKFIKTIMSKIQKVYKEVTVDETGRFSGIVNGKFVIVKLSPRFFKKTIDLVPVYKQYGYTLSVKVNDGEPKQMTIGEFLDDCTRVMPDILFRYKGLGELDGKELRTTTLDINNRISVQYTVDDAERELEIFNITHGGSKSDSAKRRALMKAYKINREDLDN